jgi:predicted nucleic acid-binding protein
LTRIPQLSVTPSLAETFIQEHIQYFEIVTLSAADYQAAIRMMVAAKLPGAGIYDAVIAQAAIAAKADQLLTLNLKHFKRLGSEISSIARTP